MCVDIWKKLLFFKPMLFIFYLYIDIYIRSLSLSIYIYVYIYIYIYLAQGIYHPGFIKAHNTCPKNMESYFIPCLTKKQKTIQYYFRSSKHNWLYHSYSFNIFFTFFFSSLSFLFLLFIIYIYTLLFDSALEIHLVFIVFSFLFFFARFYPS